MTQQLPGGRWLAPVSVSRIPRRQEGLDLQVFKGFDTDPSLRHPTAEVSDELDLVSDRHTGMAQSFQTPDECVEITGQRADAQLLAPL